MRGQFDELGQLNGHLLVRLRGLGVDGAHSVGVLVGFLLLKRFDLVFGGLRPDPVVDAASGTRIASHDSHIATVAAAVDLLFIIIDTYIGACCMRVKIYM